MDILWKSIFLDQNRLFGLDVNFYVRNRFLGSESSESNFWLIIKISSSESNLASKFIFGSNIGIWLRIGFWAQILSFWVFDSESIFGIRIGFLGFESIFWTLSRFLDWKSIFGHRVEFWDVNWFWDWSWLFWPQNRFLHWELLQKKKDSFHGLKSCKILKSNFERSCEVYFSLPDRFRKFFLFLWTIFFFLM